MVLGLRCLNLGYIAGIIDLSSHSSLVLSEVAKKLFHPLISRISEPTQRCYSEEEICIGAANGVQPILNDKKTLCLVFDGKLWNRVDLKNLLKRNGHSFSNNADGEIIIHLYEDQGEDFVNLLNGMYALALYDKEERKLILARDRIGIKPLYYTQTSRKFIFSSEIKGILASSQIAREIEPKAVLDLFLTGEVLGEKTLIRNVKRVLPGHCLVVKDSEIISKKFWDIDFEKKYVLDEEEIIHKFEENLRNAFENILSCGRPDGSYLSGGLDSTTLTLMLSSFVGDEFDTFSVTHHLDEEEKKFAKLASEVLRTKHHSSEVFAKNFRDLLYKIIWHSEEIRASDGASAYFFGAQLASESSKYVISGEGGDELFGGYRDYLDEYAASIIHHILRGRGTLSSLKEILVWVKINACMHENMHEKLLGCILEGISTRLYQKIRARALWKKSKSLFSNDFLKELRGYSPLMKIQRQTEHIDDPFEKKRYFRVRTELPNLLRVEVGCHSAFSLEVAFPFLDHKVVDLASHLKPSFLMKDMTTKHLLRRFLRYKMPNEIVSRPKSGFCLPINKWFRKDLRDFARSMLDGKTLTKSFFNRKYINKISREHEYGKKDHSVLIGTLLNFEIWYRQFICSL